MKGKVSESDYFITNMAVTFQKRKFKIPLRQVGDVYHVKEGLDAGRKHMVDAAIVRVMKARQTMDIRELQTEVLKQLTKGFQPQPTDIKKRAEDLIGREYLERDLNDPASLSYKA